MGFAFAHPILRPLIWPVKAAKTCRREKAIQTIGRDRFFPLGYIAMLNERK